MRIRHVVRLVLLAVLAVLIVANDYCSLKGQYGGQKLIDGSAVYRRIDEWMGRSPHLHPYQPVAQGSLWSFSIYDLRISDPLAVFSAPGALFVTAVIPIVATLLLGRFFCGWLCPMGLLSEFVAAVRRGAAQLRVEFFTFELTDRLKYVVLGVGIVVGALSSAWFFYHIYPPRVISDLLRDALAGRVPTVSVVFLGAILLAELLFVERLWCRCLCPGGAVYSLLGRPRLLWIRRDPVACTDCKDCDPVCPHDLRPSHKSLGGECDNCGLCRRSCEPRALHYSLSLPWKRSSSPQGESL